MTKLMKAVVTTLDEDNPLLEKEIPLPNVDSHDVLVKITASGMNPVDVKQLELAVAAKEERVLGFDGVGEVVSIGTDVKKYQVGDRVFFAGELGRTGSNAEYEAIDERLVAKAPDNLSDVETAALPLTFLTAYEMLADKFGISMVPGAASGETLLIVNGAGGVGSIMIQLAKWLGMTVIATASRDETIEWVKQLGADFVVNHREDYVSEVKRLGFPAIPYIAVLHSLDQHFEAAAELVGSYGRIGAIVQSTQPLPVGLIKNKAASLDWEFMFAKTNAGQNVASQGEALALLAELVSAGDVQSTITQTVDGFSAAAVLEAQQKVSAGDMLGKLVIKY
ncbi:zinc-binding alcohol dehydrogenase family protein [Weissella thailandensis]|uniref:Zinc-type alcohol dehydrogenase-like protein n=1 Tax=Weissella thailandensis TaxID=89061 RepID=A0ABX9I738_9LACO|nr:zinc-binding alcohol dehydrogenase family protein [Weissella thailandensis]NKY90384.1 zinc-binding alcohol dehydrogenase family protein [Weissella thailandensis]RDS60387.1 zinc-binding alcohol dehydrogenase family protein [Weissella thailandensis]GEP74651.1 NADPH:quinone reductase [Weissella thailandensis]